MGNREFIVKKNFSAAFTSSDMVNDGWSGVVVGIDVDAISTGNITVTVQGKLPDGNYYTLLASAALSGTGLVVLEIHPSIADAANLAAGAPLPNTWRINVTGTVTGLDATISCSYVS